jgi:hypothetical protein
MVDGQWVSLCNSNGEGVWIGQPTTSGTHTFSLADILPNDGYCYEIKVYFQANRQDNSNANSMVFTYTYKTALDVDPMRGVAVCVQGGTTTNDPTAAIDTGVMIVYPNRQIAVKINGTTLKNSYFTLEGYRRLGTNV